MPANNALTTLAGSAPPSLVTLDTSCLRSRTRRHWTGVSPPTAFPNAATSPPSGPEGGGALRASAAAHFRAMRRAAARGRAAGRALVRIRKLCLAFPDVEERLSHGTPTFFYRGKKTFLMFHADHHGDGRLAIWCHAPARVQSLRVTEAPERLLGAG